MVFAARGQVTACGDGLSEAPAGCLGEVTEQGRGTPCGIMLVDEIKNGWIKGQCSRMVDNGYRWFTMNNGC